MSWLGTLEKRQGFHQASGCKTNCSPKKIYITTLQAFLAGLSQKAYVATGSSSFKAGPGAYIQNS